MKKVKLIASVLAVSVLAGIFAGCGKTTKTTTDKFVSACSKMKLEELDCEDPGIEPESIEDGFYVTADEDSVDELAEVTDLYLKTFGLTGLVDTEEVSSFAAAAKLSGYEDLKDAKEISELEDITLDGAFAMQMTLNGDCADDVMDAVKNMFDIYDIKTKNLTSKEFYTSDKEGYFRFHIDISKLSPILTNSDDLMELAGNMMDEDDFEELAAGLTGDLAVSVEVNGSNVFVIAGVALNAKSPSVFGTFAKAYGIAQNPMKLAMNDKLAGSLADTAFKDFIASFRKTTIISIEDFEYACDNDLDLNNFDFFDLADIDPVDVENGLYIVSDAAMTDLIRNSDTDAVAALLRDIGIDRIMTSDDVESFGFALIFEGLEELRFARDVDEIADIRADGAFAFVVNLSNSSCSGDILDFIEDKLDDADIDLDDLTSSEYYSAEAEGYLRFHIDVNKFIDLMFENDDIYDLFDAIYGDDDVIDTLKDFSGDVAITIEVNESNIFILAGFSINTEPTYLGRFADAFNAAGNPADIPMNEDVVTDLIDYIADDMF